MPPVRYSRCGPCCSHCALCSALMPRRTPRGATYKWVDDQGVVHYTDKMPPEAINKGSIELNKQGVANQEERPGIDAGAAPSAGGGGRTRCARSRKPARKSPAQGPRTAQILYDRKRDRPVEESARWARSTHRYSRCRRMSRPSTGARTRSRARVVGAQRPNRRRPPSSAKSSTSNEELEKQAEADRHQAQGSRHRDRTLRRGQERWLRTLGRSPRPRPRRPTPRRQRGRRRRPLRSTIGVPYSYQTYPAGSPASLAGGRPGCGS